jgi:diguanylate cyclase (GGDEF)-like protein
MEIHPKRSLGHASAAIEAVAAHAPSGAVLLCLVQHASYFSAISEQYASLAQKGVTVVVAYTGDRDPSPGLHEVHLDQNSALCSHWSVTLLTPDLGAYLTAEDLVSFDPRLQAVEPGRQFAAAWGFGRKDAAQVAEYYIDQIESALAPKVVDSFRLRIAHARLTDPSPAEGALCAATDAILDRSILVEHRLAQARTALDLETLAASQDALTQLLNRRGFDRWACIDEGVGVPLPRVGLILIDLDHFKAVNDRLGHQAGDRLLQEISKVLKEGTRPSDIVCRWGGDEFLIACPSAELEELSEIAERLISSISALNAEGMSISASAGLRVGSLSAEGLLEADSALYEAKSRGGNSTMAASRPQP